jgi:hypothetical protein
MKLQDTPFKLWLMRIYMEHKDEATTYGFPTCDAASYFRTYKYWLKREYKQRLEQSK